MPFVVTTVLVSLPEHVSPLTVIFGPMPGNPLIVWLYYTVPPAAVQAVAALALRRSQSAARIAGMVGVLIVASVALAWLGGMVFIAVRWLITGALAGDFYDLLGMVFFGIPVLAVIAGLNLRAAVLAVRDLPSHTSRLRAV